MNIKEVRFGEDARSEILKGVNIVGDAVSSTMGAKGRNILIETQGGLPKITKDGVSVSRSIFLEEPLQSLGAELIKQSAEKTVDDCGDSTTTTVVLARELMNLSEEAISKGAHPIFLKNGISDATQKAVEHLKKKAIKIKTKDYKNVARISANNDTELGDTIAKAFKLAGKNGVVNYEPSMNEKTYVTKSDGLKIDRGFTSPYMATDKKTNRIEMKDPLVFVCDKKIEHLSQILPLFKRTKEEDVPILIIGEMDNQELNLFISNIIKHNLKIRFIQAPSFGSKRKDLMNDIAIATGAVMIKNEGTDNIESVCNKFLGKAKSFTANDKESFLDIDKERYQEDIDKQIKWLKDSKKGKPKGVALSFIDERIAKLSCSIAKISVGAVSDVERDEKIDRVDDAVNATKSAIEEGILPGGGLALFNASYHIGYDKDMPQDHKLGFSIAVKAMRKPIKQILENAGEDYEIIVSEIENNEDEDIGYDVLSSKMCNLLDNGIIDPHKVVRCAIQNATSVAQTYILTNGAINIKRK